MADFSRSDYASYVALCRELKLPRAFQEGDRFDGHLAEDGVYVWRRDMPTGEGDIWLPTLSDWLEMLEEAGVDGLAFGSAPSGWWIAPYQPDNSDGHGYGSTDEPVVTGPTREEAAARLWIAVRSSVPALK